MSYATVRQEQILEFLRSQPDSCTLEQMAEAFGSGVRMLQLQLNRLIKKGLIRGSSQPRSAREDAPAPMPPAVVPPPAKPVPAVSPEFLFSQEIQITERQSAILQLLRRSPFPLRTTIMIQQVGERLGVNDYAVQCSMISLRRKGLVDFRDGLVWLVEQG